MHMRLEAIILAAIGATLIFVFLGIDPVKSIIERKEFVETMDQIEIDVDDGLSKEAKDNNIE